jgi:hypothetical protein
MVSVKLVPNLESLHGLEGLLDNIFELFSVVSRTLTGIIDNYFGGYYTEKMLEAQVGLCLQYPSPV